MEFDAELETVRDDDQLPVPIFVKALLHGGALSLAPMIDRTIHNRHLS